ncbi:hypothetical protein [Enterobacter hormaechei]|uniref:hypothetical protein n=1 Tax=Enterobacter hormaechei TaxID=158836 RepID=UPI0032B099B2
MIWQPEFTDKTFSRKHGAVQSYQIHITWTGWSKAKRTVVRKELEAARTEAQEARAKRLKDKAKVFFIGEQSAENPENFYVTDYRLICALVGHMT